MGFTIHHGDCLDVLKTMPDNSVDSVVTDPPYGLSFMGRKWDYDVPSVEIWAEVLRVLKPGGHLVSFAGTRTQHRMAVNIEDAGFTIRDMLAWVYGSGFPKSLDVSKAIDKRKDWEALARLGEAIRSARKAIGLSQTEAARLVGLIGPDESLGGGGFMWFETGRLPTRDEWPRIKSALSLGDEFDAAFAEAEREVIGQHAEGTSPGGFGEHRFSFNSRDITAPATDAAREWQGWGTALKPALEPITLARKPLGEKTVAAQVMATGTGALNVDGCRVGRAPDDVSGWSKTGSAASENRAMSGQNYERKAKPDSPARFPANLLHDGSEEVVGLFPGVGDKSAARFMYCAKASKRDRDEGLEGLEPRSGGSMCANTGDVMALGAASLKGEHKPRQPARNVHPTVKPTDLMRWLCRLVTPPGGVILDPFTGSGSTGKAALSEGFAFIGIEREAEYVEIARRRCEAASDLLAVAAE